MIYRAFKHFIKDWMGKQQFFHTNWFVSKG